MKHTELPFHLMKDGFAKSGLWSAPTIYAADDELRYVAVCACADHLNFHSATDNLANAEFIVKACNNHYELLDALKDTEYFLTQIDPVHFPDRKKARETIAQIREAIKKAE